MSDTVHLTCGTIGMKPMFNPREPPDPDRHGNRRWTYRCPSCGEKVTDLDTRHGPGGLRDPAFKRVDDVDWLVELP